MVAAIIAGSCVAGLLFLGGCGLLIKTGIDEAGDEFRESAIDREQYDAATFGSSREALETRLGEPYDTETYHEIGGPVSCLYYNDRDDLFSDDYYTFCFFNGKLDTKSPP